MNDKTSFDISDILYDLQTYGDASVENLTQLLDDLNLTYGTSLIDDTTHELTQTQREYLIKVKESFSYTTKRYWIDTILNQGWYTEGDRQELNALKNDYQCGKQ